MKLWVETWKTAGPLLEQIKRDELRAMSEEEAGRIANELALAHAQVKGRPAASETSGLIEQQRWFRKWKN